MLYGASYGEMNRVIDGLLMISPEESLTQFEVPQKAAAALLRLVDWRTVGCQGDTGAVFLQGTRR